MVYTKIRTLPIVEDLVAQPHERVLQVSRDEAVVQRVYEFRDNA